MSVACEHRENTECENMLKVWRGENALIFFAWLVFELPDIVRVDLGFWMCERERIKRCMYFSIDQCVGKLVGENESLLWLAWYDTFTWNEFESR
jgi:hypothetical protein